MGHGSPLVCPQLSSSRTSLEVAPTLAGGGTQQEQQVPAQWHKERMRKASVVHKGSCSEQEGGQSSWTSRHCSAQACTLCSFLGAPLLLIVVWSPTAANPSYAFLSNLIFSGIEPVLAFGNWHSLCWQMLLICSKQCVQCDLFCLNSLHNENILMLNSNLA